MGGGNIVLVGVVCVWWCVCVVVVVGGGRVMQEGMYHQEGKIRKTDKAVVVGKAAALWRSAGGGTTHEAWVVSVPPEPFSNSTSEILHCHVYYYSWPTAGSGQGCVSQVVCGPTICHTRASMYRGAGRMR